MNNQQTPQRLILTEVGYTEPLAPWQSDEVEEPEWIELGWHAITSEGWQHFLSKDKAAVLSWLAEQGYADTGDGLHYELPEPEPEITNVIIPCHMMSDQARAELENVGASIHPDVLWGELADVILVVVPCRPGTYQCMWQHGILRELQTPELSLVNVHHSNTDQLELQCWDGGETTAADTTGIGAVEYIEEEQPFEF